MDVKISRKWRWAIQSLFFCAIIFQLSLNAEEVKKEETPGPQVVSKTLIPFPPRPLEPIKDIQVSSQAPAAEEESTEPESEPAEETDEKTDPGCKSYDDSMCRACNPPIQDVGETCVAYQKQADGTCVCTACETVECGSS